MACKYCHDEEGTEELCLTCQDIGADFMKAYDSALKSTPRLSDYHPAQSHVELVCALLSAIDELEAAWPYFREFPNAPKAHQTADRALGLSPVQATGGK